MANLNSTIQVKENLIKANQEFLNKSYDKFFEDNLGILCGMSFTINRFREEALKISNDIKKSLVDGLVMEYGIFQAHRWAARELFSKYTEGEKERYPNNEEVFIVLEKDEAFFESHWEISKLQNQLNWVIFKGTNHE